MGQFRQIISWLETPFLLKGTSMLVHCNVYTSDSKKNLPKKLVSVYKHGLFLIFLILSSSVYSQNEVKWSLEKCIDTAMVHNKKLQISRNNTLISKEKRKEVKGNLLPKIGINAAYKYYTNLPYRLMPMELFGGPEGQFKEAQFGVSHNINANVQLSMPIYNPKLMGTLNTLQLATEMSDLQRLKTEEQVYFEVSNLYYNSQLIHHQILFLDSNIVNSQTLLASIQLAHQQLVAKETDVTKVQLQLAQLKTKKRVLTAKWEQLLNGLKVMIGIPVEQKIKIENEIDFSIINDQQEFKNINLQLAEKHKQILKSELKTIKHSRIPSLSLVGNYGATGFGYDKSPNQFLNFYPVGFVGVRFHYPLFNGLTINKKITQKNLELNNAALNLSLLHDQTTLELRNAKQQKQLSTSMVEDAYAQLELAQELYDQTVLQQKQGNASLTEVLIANNTLRESQQSYLSSIVEYYKADLEMKKITGEF